MANEENKEVIRRYWDVLNSRDAKGATTFWAADATNHGMKRTREQVQLLHESLLQVYEHLTIHEMVSEGEWVACRLTAQGRHRAQPTIPFDSGIYLLTKPDGRPFSFQHMHMFRVVDGKIKEHWANRDDVGAAKQLGLELKPVDKFPERSSDSA
jgi:predicted ester cyclase